MAVSRYGQQLLSGVPRPGVTAQTPPPLVDLKPGDGHYHHLIVRQQAPEEPLTDANALAPLDVKLTTVQFYDLMEAVDQLLADTQTLPDLTAEFQAVSRRQVRPEEPIAKRAAPAALGAAALAAAGLALFFVPPPEFEPTRPNGEANTPAETTPAPVEAGTEPEDNSVEPTPEPVETEAEPEENSAETTPVPGEAEAESSEGSGDEATREEDATRDSGSVAGAESVELPTIETKISDGNRIRALNQSLYDRLLDELAPISNTEALAYRVRLTEAGDIVGYEAISDAARNLAQETPIPGLVSKVSEADEQADFRVVFTETGVLEVSPWDGWPQ
jgi:hypothetical protein